MIYGTSPDGFRMGKKYLFNTESQLLREWITILELSQNTIWRDHIHQHDLLLTWISCILIACILCYTEWIKPLLCNPLTFLYLTRESELKPTWLDKVGQISYFKPRLWLGKPAGLYLDVQTWSNKLVRYNLWGWYTDTDFYSVSREGNTSCGVTTRSYMKPVYNKPISNQFKSLI